ncbi:hypothetical protein [Shinella sp. BYT-45]|uniref:hypothetical protein n=1 Tax=Shinella sp. BYT-45 TaxID=3377377 RepID=UPI0039802797
MSRSANVRKPSSLVRAGAKKTPSAAGLKKLDEAITLFDEMIRLLDDSSLPQQIEAGLPSEPLPSLLQQCEQIASRSEAELPQILVAFPGMPPLNLSWWRGHAAGVKLYRLPEQGDENDLHISESVVRAMQQECAREGRELFFLATPFALSSAFDPTRTRLLVCHPWRAYAAAGVDLGFSLDGFCAALLERLPDLAEPLCYEDLGDSREEQAKILLGRQTFPGSANAQEGKPIDYFGWAPAYEALCTRFGFDPYRLFGADWITSSASVVPLAAPQDGGAQVSWFLPRVAALLPPDAADSQVLLAQIDTALAADAVPEALDALFSTLEGEDRALAMLLVAAHFTRKGETLLAMGLVTEALDEAPPHAQSLVTLGASLYLNLGRGALALEALASSLRRPGLLAAPQIDALDTALYGEAAKSSNGEHGHALLMSYLRDMPPLPLQRRRLMVEIGTTRESVPGQGSTRKLAQLCAELGLDFVTVDMDPSNSRRAQRMFKRLGLPFKAITAKGEDYLAAHPGPIDYIFLDAYDFDHGNHSEQRQSRYERYLGDRISDAACHQMHLDCAHSLVNILADDGLICFDDTWKDDEGKWTAKGKTAMPFLLENDFEVIMTYNHAALLRRRER